MSLGAHIAQLLAHQGVNTFADLLQDTGTQLRSCRQLGYNCKV